MVTGCKVQFMGGKHECCWHAAGIFICVVNAKLAHDYGGDTIRYAKSDPIDSLKLAGYCLDKWVKLKRYQPEDETRKTLKMFNRQLAEYAKMKTMLKNNLVALAENRISTAGIRNRSRHARCWKNACAADYR
jgi:transposase